VRSLLKAGRLVRDAWLMLGLAIVLCCLVEGGARLVLSVHRWVGHSPSHPIDPRFRADTYSDSSFARTYYEEYERSNVVRWRPYVYWRRKPYHSEYINVDTSGLRITPALTPSPSGSTRPLTIFMFGGSTMWGTGARDAFSIPALVARELQHAGVSSEVTNFGETGYVSTQNLIALMLELRVGRRPDVVVFYDGINDTYSAYSQQRVGVPHNEWNRVDEFNLSSAPLTRQGRVFVGEMAPRLAILHLTQRVLRRVGLADSAPRPPRPDSLTRLVISTYLSNVELLQALGAHYRFEPLAYWQPTVFQKPRLTKYESAERAKVPVIGAFFQKTYARLKASDHDGLVHDLSDVFADVSDPVYVDWMHIGEAGNAFIARQIAGDILSAMAGAERRSP
jgi:lysophospholipase L1-like esterase